jgi:8-oxo-dGTP pyrophosphatase MutT (NUDIX family)
MTTKPTPATTTMLLRGAPYSDAIEVLLVRRPKNMRTFADIWVFPGGQVDRADHAVAAEDGHQGMTERPSIRLAACRELFEEVGVLLARSADGRPVGQPQVRKLLQRRPEFIAEPASFYRALCDESLTLAVDTLIPWSRWITPPVIAKRFDTVFFAAEFPEGSRVELHEGEISETRWVDLKSISVSEPGSGMRLAPPTTINLLDLQHSQSAHDNCAAMLRAEQGRAIASIQPKILTVDGEPWAVFPWDSQFALVDGEALPAPMVVPEYLRSLPGRLSAALPNPQTLK